MTTKEQERKALEQIKKIVAGLGEDSYIATAFEGCFEIAEQNIENDFACSMKQRADRADAEIRDLQNEVKELNDEIDGLKAIRQQLEKKVEECAADYEILDERCRRLVKEKQKAERDAIIERKDVRIETTDGDKELKQFKKIEFFGNYADFKFVNVVEKSGWTNSYKIDDLKVFEIQ